MGKVKKERNFALKKTGAVHDFFDFFFWKEERRKGCIE
jgi:hypothetical protein